MAWRRRAHARAPGQRVGPAPPQWASGAAAGAAAAAAAPARRDPPAAAPPPPPADPHTPARPPPRSEETRCRFCHSLLPDWRPALTPDALKPKPSVMSVRYR
jgi:hypothetical protein